MMPDSQRGFSLTEVLVSLLLLSFALLGFEAMEVDSLKNIRSTYYAHAAVEQLHHMAEQLRSMHNDAEMEQIEEEWNLQNEQVLPEGKGEVSGLFPSYTITLFWGGKKECTDNQLGKVGCLKEEIQME